MTQITPFAHPSIETFDLPIQDPDQLKPASSKRKTRQKSGTSNLSKMKIGKTVADHR